jgi:uncharacterized protein YecE (DUF72 family)
MAKQRRSGEPLPLFPDEHPETRTSAFTAANGERIRRWASKGVYFGTSSWKYPGWKGQVYLRDYPSKKIFDRECLGEYAALFPTVCADFALYDFPRAERMQEIHDQTPEGFRVSLKVTDRITVKRFPNIPRYGPSAGTENPDFLNVELFEDAFLKPIETLRHKRGVIIFEFSTFHPAAGVTTAVFTGLLDRFLARLPQGYAFAVEVRNKEFLTADYLAMLHSHGVAHVFNNWTRMPPVIEQLQIAGILTAPVAAVRSLLKPGRTYEDAVERFQPYDAIREENPEARLGVAEAVKRCIVEGRTLFAYINNRVEGNAPKTIEGILDLLDQYPLERLQGSSPR